MRKATKYFAIALCVVITAWLLVQFGLTAHPVKTSVRSTDRLQNPHATAFNFEKGDLQSLPGELKAAFGGMEKRQVEQILVEKLGALAEPKERNIVKYRYRNWKTKVLSFINSACSGYVVEVVYDDQNIASEVNLLRSGC